VKLQEKVALVTGAARGIGRACAERFAHEGACLALLDVAADVEGVPYKLGTRSQLEHTAEICREIGSPVLAMAADVRDSRAVETTINQVLDRFGRIDVLVNSAGIVSPSGQSAHEISEAQWQLMIDVDLTGTWRMLKAAAPDMLRRRSGSIINVSSTAGTVGYRHFAAYVAAKHGVVGLTRAAAIDFAPLRVRVNALCPGSVRDTPEFEGQMLKEIARSLDVSLAEHERLFCESQPTNELLVPEDVAAASLWLASDDSRHVTGSVLTVDGGFTAK
jgi:NAD(P)-dependent dehydrogenase (short-subunit alcohol dehydrogenase family)